MKKKQKRNEKETKKKQKRNKKEMKKKQKRNEKNKKIIYVFGFFYVFFLHFEVE